ncbi:hypothetical protein SUSAZ_09210 [Sulfolobus acidocaldarius SUSAZ]|nr:hypothetical protein SUSAZ_09210 [Sulfolobus acidocaldarius SUSAZ]
MRKLLAPIVFSLFMIGWYEFSEIYLSSSNVIAQYNGDFSVYVTPPQFQGYLTVTLWVCYFFVYVGLALFWYNLVKMVQEAENFKVTFGLIDVVSPIAIALEIMLLFLVGNSIIGQNMIVRMAGYSSVIACLMWFWYSLVKYVRVKVLG